MATHFFPVALFLLISANYAVAVDFTCPTDPIYKQSGTFPKDQLSLTTFPNNYDCTINFLIDDGYVFKLTIRADVTDGSGEFLVVTNALGTQKKYTAGETVFFAPAQSASLQIKTKTGNSRFWFSYESIDMTLATLNHQFLYPTGAQINLATKQIATYTIISPKNDSVVINTAKLDDISLVDPSLRSIYVYDGADVTAPFVGNLYDYVMSTKFSKSSGNATTLANFYGTMSSNFALGNDYKSIITYDTYTFVAYTKNVTIPKNFMDGISNVYTFYCAGDSDTSFLTDLNFGSNSFKADVRPLTPSDIPNVLLSYVSSRPVSLYMPQMIPGRLFTMVTLGPELSITLSTEANNWLAAYNGRLGYIFSASLWNPGALPSYNYTFESTQLMTFAFNFQSVIVHQAGEIMNIKVGTPGSQPASVTYTSTVTNQARVANGTYLTASYTGNNPTSSSIISFQMTNANGIGPTTKTPTTTTAKVETTTKSGGKYELFVVFVVFVMTFL